MILADCFWWEFLLRHPGILAVLIGVLGEVICDWKKSKEAREKLKQLFAVVLVGGLAYEMFEAVQLDKEVGGALKQAGEAHERAANTESNNLILRSNILALELKLQPRTITKRQTETFSTLLKDVTKGPLVWGIRRSDPETIAFSDQLLNAVTNAGFEVESLRVYPDNWTPTTPTKPRV